MARNPHSPLVYSVISRFVAQCLREDGALFGAQTLWTASNLALLKTRFSDAPDLRELSFEAKLKDQFAGANPAALALMAEIVYLYELPQADKSAEAKRASVAGVLGRELPEPFDAALEQGIGRFSMARMHKYRALALLINVFAEFKARPQPEREALLADPWRWRELVLRQSGPASFQSWLLHLVHPETFEPILLEQTKRDLVAAMGARLGLGLDTDLDRALLKIRSVLAPRLGEGFPMVDVLALTSTPLAIPLPFGNDIGNYHTAYTRLRPKVYAPQELYSAIMSTRPRLENIDPNATPEEVAEALSLLRFVEPLGDGTYRPWAHLTGGSPKTAIQLAILGLLEPTGSGYRLPALDMPWDGAPHPAEAWGSQFLRDLYITNDLIAQQDNGYASQLGAVRARVAELQDGASEALTSFIDHLQQAQASRRALALVSKGLRRLEPAQLEARIAELQRELLIDGQTVKRVYRALIAGQHVILSGPPGTGKTHLAKLLPQVLWREEAAATRLTIPADPSVPPHAELIEETIDRHGYRADVVTATEQWSPRDIIGGISPQLVQDGGRPTLVYGVRHGYLTRAVLANYSGYDGQRVPEALQRIEFIEDGRRHHGRWLIIDEFTRAPIDAALGGLLTTLGGQRDATFAVPTDSGGEALIALPEDFRIIGTLNSFDRHFLNQMSEALKRRFVFIDILPPGREQREAESAIAIYRALGRLAGQEAGIVVDAGARSVRWDGVLTAEHDGAAYSVTYASAEASAASERFWEIFDAIRVYRALGTAQAEAVYAALFSGVLVGFTWPEALDYALADVLADQLQVLHRDEQEAVLAYARATGLADFGEALKQILKGMPVPRRKAHLALLSQRLVGTALQGEPSTAQIEAIFSAPQHGSVLPERSEFVRRLQGLIGERGL